jgi:hypothetical protein
MSMELNQAGLSTEDAVHIAEMIMRLRAELEKVRFERSELAEWKRRSIAARKARRRK